jgi:imidazolonepropionase-like amidohydrolase
MPLRSGFCFAAAAAFLVYATGLAAQNPLYPGTQPFVAVDAPVIALEHVRVIDGTGAAPREDQTLVIADGKIRDAGPAAQVAIPPNARRLNLANHTVIPGLVGMHEHLFYPSGGGVAIYTEHAFSFPRLYLASGVTTARTAGTLEPHTDLNIKKLIDAGRMPGPKLLITAGYLEGKGMFTPQMTEVDTPEDARRFVEYWAAQGAHSFKAYMNISRAALGAAIQTAHERRLTLTGHLCSVTFREAAALGIDNLEHGLIEDTDFIPGKAPDVCPANQPQVFRQLDVSGEPVRETIQTLVQHKVAITSTLAVFERNPVIQKRFLDALSPGTALNYMTMRARGPAPTTELSAEIRKELAFERAFVKAGGLLMAGADPTGNGSALAGYADQRNIEMLVEGGFSPEDAIRIATLNGAEQLGLASTIGSIANGKQADMVLIEGNPAARIADIENIKLVFKDGVGYDPAKLTESIRGHVGLH